MTLFGRDALITSLQTMLLRPEPATAALRALAALQATEDDPAIDAEPGKILHELRRGKAAESWFPVYYGTVDATPLWLVLLSEVWRWTGDDALVRELEPAARAALAWIDHYGDLDGDGFVEYARRAPNGLANQSWKDSGDSQQFRDGRLADGADRARRGAGLRLRRAAPDGRAGARGLAATPRSPPSWSDGAAELRDRFDRAFWLEERGSLRAGARRRQASRRRALLEQRAPALVRDRPRRTRRGRGRRARARTSSGRAGASARWARREAGYNPLGYHTGTVWPHDTALAAWGLARVGAREQAWQLVRSLLEAARFFDHSLPEVFAGYPRTETAFPVAYPTAARPQAWAAGAPILCLRLLLGLHPDPSTRGLATRRRGRGARLARRA